MADLKSDMNIKRAKALLKSAQELHEEGGLAGVAGLAYQAFESIVMALAKERDKPNHVYRSKLAAEILNRIIDDKANANNPVASSDKTDDNKTGTPKKSS